MIHEHGLWLWQAQNDIEIDSFVRIPTSSA
jgi:hypothetical protein